MLVKTPTCPTVVSPPAPGAAGEWKVEAATDSVKSLFVDNPLEVYTKWTGGREYGFLSQGGLERAVSPIGDEVHSQYLLSYRLPANATGGYHELRVEVARPDLEVRTRPGYWIAGPAEEKEKKK